jgi:dTDP-4-amino-4,6-dideoxygalactose transaminase
MNGPLPFVDLASQQDRIRAELERRMGAVLAHGSYIMGPEVAELEQSLAAFARVRHVVTCGSGTDALLMALMAREVGPGDAVIVPTFTFASTAEVVALAGATPVFADVRPDTCNLDPEVIPLAVDTARAAGLRPVAVVPVDLFGLPAAYERIVTISAELGLWVLADAAQSLGASVGEMLVGTWGDMSATSFFPAKPLGCYGDGGAVLTDDATLADRLRSVRVHGKGSDKYDNVRIGINGRLDTLQAAILLAKLEVFADELVARHEIAARYGAGLQEVAGIVVPSCPPGTRSTWAQYTIKLDGDRDRVASDLRERGIPTAVYYPRPLHRQSAYAKFPRAGELAVSDALSQSVLSLPMHPYLATTDQDRIIDAVIDVTRSA